MEDFIFAILASIAEVLLDALLEALLEGAFAGLTGILSRTVRIFKIKIRRADPVLATMLFSLVGIASGFMSVMIFPHHLIRPSRMYPISLLISPILTGLLMAQIGRTVRKFGRQSVRIESFGYGFIFALAMGLVRFWLIP